MTNYYVSKTQCSHTHNTVILIVSEKDNCHRLDVPGFRSSRQKRGRPAVINRDLSPFLCIEMMR